MCFRFYFFFRWSNDCLHSAVRFYAVLLNNTAHLPQPSWNIWYCSAIWNTTWSDWLYQQFHHVENIMWQSAKDLCSLVSGDTLALNSIAYRWMNTSSWCFELATFETFWGKLQYRRRSMNMNNENVAKLAFIPCRPCSCSTRWPGLTDRLRHGSFINASQVKNFHLF